MKKLQEFIKRMLLLEVSSDAAVKAFIREFEKIPTEWLTASRGGHNYTDAMLKLAEKYFEPLRMSEYRQAEGTFRKVFGIDSERVLKIARPGQPWSWSFDMNKEEANNKLGTTFPDLFPKVYERATNYAWIIVEKVEVIKTETEFISFFQDMLHVLQEFDFGTWTDIQMGRLIIYLFEYSLLIARNAPDDIRDMSLSRVLFSINKSNLNHDSLEKIFNALLSKKSRLYSRIIEFLMRYNAAPTEIRPANVGVAPDGRFVILDASIF